MVRPAQMDESNRLLKEKMPDRVSRIQTVLLPHSDAAADVRWPTYTQRSFQLTKEWTLVV